MKLGDVLIYICDWNSYHGSLCIIIDKKASGYYVIKFLNNDTTWDFEENMLIERFRRIETKNKLVNLCLNLR